MGMGSAEGEAGGGFRVRSVGVSDSCVLLLYPGEDLKGVCCVFPPGVYTADEMGSIMFPQEQENGATIATNGFEVRSALAVKSGLDTSQATTSGGFGGRTAWR